MSTPTSGVWLFVISPTFLPYSRALTRTTCPTALDNGLFTRRSIPPGGDPGHNPCPRPAVQRFSPGRPAARIPRRPPLYSVSHLQHHRGIPPDVPSPPRAPLGVSCRGRPLPDRRDRPGRAVLRGLLQAPRRAVPAPRGVAGAPVRLCPGRPPDGPVRRDPPLPDRHPPGPAAAETGLHRDRGQPLLPAPRRRLQRRVPRGLAARDHPRQARAGGVHHHPAGRA